MISKLRNTENLSLQNLQRRINSGEYRFIAYPYSISLLAGNIYMVSPAYLLKKEDIKKHTLKYNFISFIFGWWSIPNGPTNTLNSIKTNRKGGIDVTEDIMLNLTEEDSLRSKKVKIEVLYTLFKHPSKSDIKDFIKSIKKTKSLNLNQKIYLGRYLDTKEVHYFIRFENISNVSKDDLLKNLRKIYYDHIQIEVGQTDKKDELDQKIITQGIKLNIN